MNDTTIAMMRLAQKGYSCSQIIMSLALENRGESNPSLIRSMAGLAYGCGSGSATCGALTGACCALGLYAGKGDDTEQESESLLMMMEELSEWFENRVNGITCNDVVGEDGPAASRRKCGTIVAEVYDKTIEILAAHGFDPAG